MNMFLLLFLSINTKDEMTHEQIPAVFQTPNDTITTPIVNLPLKDRLSDHSSQLSGERDRGKNDGIRLFEANTASKGRKLNHAGKVQDLSKTIKAALNSWSTKRAESLSPFKYLMSILENTLCALKYNDERMLLENVLLLMPGPVI
jgi:hypothetical protein